MYMYKTTLLQAFVTPIQFHVSTEYNSYHRYTYTSLVQIQNHNSNNYIIPKTQYHPSKGKPTNKARTLALINEKISGNLRSLKLQVTNATYAFKQVQN